MRLNDAKKVAVALRKVNRTLYTVRRFGNVETIYVRYTHLPRLCARSSTGVPRCGVADVDEPRLQDKGRWNGVLG